MKQLFLFVLSTLFLFPAFGQENQARPKIMTLGVFHFSYPNEDLIKTDEKDQLDVLDEQRQKELRAIVDALKTFRPTRILVEAQPASGRKIDSVFYAYKAGNYRLRKNEIQQLGFRLAHELNLPSPYCVDEWGKYYESLEFLFDDSNPRTQVFNEFYFNNPDTVFKHPAAAKNHKTALIVDMLLSNNDPEIIKSRLGIYLIGPYKYEEKEGDYMGVDFETGRWFNRNFRIFRNIQRIATDKEDRLLLIIGAEHLNILNYLIECSPEYDYESPLPYLRDARRKIVH